MERILCPVNFTDTALNAIEYASALASLHQGKLTLFHVVLQEEYKAILEEGEGDLQDHLTRGQNDLERRLKSLCEEIVSSYPDLMCQMEIGYGSLTNAIIDRATKEAYDLIVMGNDGVTDVTEAMVGSSTVKVIERAPCPVLSVPNQADFQGLQKVVYGTQFNKADQKALNDLMLMLQPLGSHIDVVHILKPDGRKEKAKKQMDELKSYLNFSRIGFHIREHEENARLGLDDFMEEVKGELLVMVTHQRGFFERVFQKSNVKNISYFADYPILIFLKENLLKK